MVGHIVCISLIVLLSIGIVTNNRKYMNFCYFICFVIGAYVLYCCAASIT